ncbi:ABC transporter permease [Anaerocolumna sp. AGMB13020]|uniref:ABC transporter permease n=1 Tax=Anaerocolumna sp. AGMB13020 TaxID=3081750 RepID=UPI002954D15B|nr:ABC transporter permease [Anaerocolumna sp. AGMB13020]WOO38214.1 ABC transporter permease [Anaerocolumna sp. AGMB13020]
MTISLRRIKALTKKEFKSFTKNSNVLLMCLLPIIFSILYTYIYGSSENGIPKLMVLLLCLNMNLIMCSSFTIAMLIAEEKEKNTLRTLLLSGVSALEFLFGKVVLTLILSTLTNILIYFICGIEVKYLGWFLLITTLVIISMIIIGALIGMFSKNQMSTSVVGMPVLLVFLLIPMMAEFNENVKKIAKFTPNYNMNVILSKVLDGGVLSSQEILPFVSIFVWIVLTGVGFIITYNKVGIDK